MVTVGGHRLLTSHGKSERFSGKLGGISAGQEAFPSVCGVEPKDVAAVHCPRVFGEC